VDRPSLTSFEAIIPGQPYAWPRPDSRGRARFNPKGYAAWQKVAAEALAAQARWRSFPGEVAITLVIHPDGVDVRAASLIRHDPQRPPALRGDLDNYAKAIIDAMQVAGVMGNDRQMVSLDVTFHPQKRFT
jgi:Holliday junction resolvase RusA-like endonuclease